MSDLGMLRLTTQTVDMGDGGFYRMITGAEWEGPPVALIHDQDIYELPDWAIALDGSLVQIGEYVLRNTGIYDWPSLAAYYYRVDDGLPYWVWWRLMRAVEGFTVRAVLTLAVWGLGAWPKQGTIPSWRDVKRRWQP